MTANPSPKFVSREPHKQPLYSLCWSTDVVHSHEKWVIPPTQTGAGAETGLLVDASNNHCDATMQYGTAEVCYRYFTTAGANSATVYEVVSVISSSLREESPSSQPKSTSDLSSYTLVSSPPLEGMIRPIQVYIDDCPDELFYCCCYGGHSYVPSTNPPPVSPNYHPPFSTETHTGPQLLALAGKNRVVKIVDSNAGRVVVSLMGHGDDVYDMRWGEISEWILITASKDNSLRLWSVMTACPLLILAGHFGHRDSVLSLDVSPDGKRLVSGGMDTCIKIWGLETERYSVASAEKEARAMKGVGWLDHSDISKPPIQRVFETRTEQIPLFSTSRIHTDYVDCVRYIGRDLLATKSTGNSIVIWKPVFDGQSEKNLDGGDGGGKVVAMREIKLKDCEIWFVRFDIDLKGQNLGIGNKNGVIKVWGIENEEDEDEVSDNPRLRAQSNLCKSAVRMVRFSPQGDFFAGVCDNGSLLVYDCNFSAGKKGGINWKI